MENYKSEAVKKRKRYRYVIFDVDGTLMDTDAAVSHAVAELLVEMKIFEEKEVAELVQEAEGNIIPALLQYIHGKVPGLEKKEILNLLKERYTEEIWKRYAKPFDGVPEMIGNLKKSGIVTGIFTNGLADASEKMLSIFGMKDFAFYLGYTQKEQKPEVGRLKAYFEINCISPAEVLMVGDTDTDLDTAFNAGIDFGCAAWNIKSRLIENDAEDRYLIFKHPQELTDIIMKEK